MEETAPAEEAEGAAEAMGEPIAVGIPAAFGSTEEAASLKAIELAVKEIDASGGVDVGGEHRSFEIVTIGTHEHGLLPLCAKKTTGNLGRPLRANSASVHDAGGCVIGGC